MIKKTRNQKTDYQAVINFIKAQKSIIFVVELHKFLESELAIKNVSHRSKIIKRLIDLRVIERVGDKSSRSLVRLIKR